MSRRGIPLDRHPCVQRAGDLEECLDSVLNQSFRDIEVIAVNHGSPDHSGSILDERARLDDRLTVIHLDRTPDWVPPATAA